MKSVVLGICVILSIQTAQAVSFDPISLARVEAREACQVAKELKNKQTQKSDSRHKRLVIKAIENCAKRRSILHSIKNPTPNEMKKDNVCIMVYAPVCGKDKITYSNRCIAESAGVEVDKDGQC